MSELDAFKHEKPGSGDTKGGYEEETPAHELNRLAVERHGTAERAVSTESLENERRLLREQIDEKRKIADGLDHSKESEIVALRASADTYEKDFEAIAAARAQFGYADQIYAARKRDTPGGPLAQ